MQDLECLAATERIALRRRPEPAAPAAPGPGTPVRHHQRRTATPWATLPPIAASGRLSTGYVRRVSLEG